MPFAFRARFVRIALICLSLCLSTQLFGVASAGTGDVTVVDVTNDSCVLYAGAIATGVVGVGEQFTIRTQHSDMDGPTDIAYVDITVDVGGWAAVFRWNEATDAFSERADPNNYFTLSSTSADSSSAGNQWTLDWKLTVTSWSSDETNKNIRAYIVDDPPTSYTDQDDYTSIFRVENDLTSASLAVNDYHVNPSQTLTFTGYWYYAGTSVAPPDGDYQVIIKLSGSQKGSTDTTLVSGAFSISGVDAEATVDSYDYTVEASYMTAAGSFSSVVVDKIKVSSYTVADTRVNINENVNIDATVVYQFDLSAVTTGTITINGYSASHQGSGVYRITSTSASAGSVTYDTVAGSETAYGLNTVNQNGQSVTVAWDRIRILTLGLTDSRINADDAANSTLYATADLEFDSHTLGSGDSLTIGGVSLSWNGTSSRFEGFTATSSSVTSATYDTFTSGSEATYGITAGNMNSKSATIVWDKIRWDTVSASSTSLSVGSSSEIRVTASLEFDDHTLESGDTLSINGVALTWDATDARWEASVTKSSAQSVTYSSLSGSEADYGITAVNQNDKSVTVTWTSSGGGGGGAPTIIPRPQSNPSSHALSGIVDSYKAEPSWNLWPTVEGGPSAVTSFDIIIQNTGKSDLDAAITYWVTDGADQKVAEGTRLIMLPKQSTTETVSIVMNQTGDYWFHAYVESASERSEEFQRSFVINWLDIYLPSLIVTAMAVLIVFTVLGIRWWSRHKV